ncbi:MAG: malectin domain-containing carbohydrate-binding protein, partial [Pyrinomonadaceae bacterium]
LAYAIPLANGNYTVRLLFAETWFGVGTTGGAGSRLFDISIENVLVLTNFDIYATAGGPLKAVVKTFSVTVSDGVLNISASGNYPKFNAIEVVAGN